MDIGSAPLVDPHPDPTLDLAALADRLAALRASGARPTRALDAAQARLAAGTLGACCRCGGPIERDRVLNDPTVAFCRVCRDL